MLPPPVALLFLVSLGGRGAGFVIRVFGGFVTALENCDMVAATLCGVTEVRQLKRSACAMDSNRLGSSGENSPAPIALMARASRGEREGHRQ